MTTDIAERTIARLEAKLASAPDAQSALYYRLCLAGWHRWLDNHRDDAQAAQGAR